MTEIFDAHQRMANIKFCFQATGNPILMVSEIFELCSA